MANTINKSKAIGQEEIEDTYSKKHKYFLCFPITYYEKISSESLGNDIVIQTDRPIRRIYLNEELIKEFGI